MNDQRASEDMSENAISSEPLENWESKKLEEICEITTGKLNAGEAVEDGDYPFFTCDPETARIDSYSFNTEAVLLAGNNANGEFNVKYYSGKFDVYQRTYVVTSQDEEKLDNRFLYYSLNLKLNFLKAQSVGTATQYLTMTILNDIDIKLPPLDVQKKIVQVLGVLDEKIQINNKINEGLEEMAQTLFKSWFVDLSNYDGETEYDEEFERDVPKAWEKASLDDIAEFLNGKAWKDYSSENGEENDLPVVKIKELRNGISDDSDEVARSECPDKYILDDGDIVFSWSASLVLDLWSEGDAFLNQHLFKVTSQKYPRWFCYLWIDHHIRLFRHIAEAKRTTMGHIKRTDLEEAKVLIPPEEKIKEMSEKMKPIFEKRVKTQVENGNLEELRDTLLPKLMSGEVRVNDISLDELEVDSEV